MSDDTLPGGFREGEADGVLGFDSASAESVGLKPVPIRGGKVWDVGVLRPRSEGREESKSQTNATRAFFSSSNLRRA